MIDANEDVHTALVESDERGTTLRLPAGLFQPGDRLRVRREGTRVTLELDGPAPAADAPAGDWPPGFRARLCALPEPTFDRPEQLPGSTTYRDQVIEDWVEEMNGGTPEPWPGSPFGAS